MLIQVSECYQYQHWYSRCNVTWNVSIESRWCTVTRYLVITWSTFEGFLIIAFIGFVLGLKFRFCQKVSTNSSIRNCLEITNGIPTWKVFVGGVFAYIEWYWTLIEENIVNFLDLPKIMKMNQFSFFIAAQQTCI